MWISGRAGAVKNKNFINGRFSGIPKRTVREIRNIIKIGEKIKIRRTEKKSAVYTEVIL